MLFPTVQRHASPRNGAAMEFVQHEPFSIGVDVAGWGGTYEMICVGGMVGVFCVEVDDVRFCEDGLVADGWENEKNCPTPKSTTIARITITAILLVLFLLELERLDDILHQRIYFCFIE